MEGTSQGNSYPDAAKAQSESRLFGASHHDPDNTTTAPTCTDVDVEWAETVRKAKEQVQQLEAFNAESGQRGTSWALPVEPSEQSRVPIWSGRAEWLRQLRHQVTETEQGRAVLAANRIAVDTLMACANAHARFAETRTGRGVTASKARIAEHAGASNSTIMRSRRVLKALAMGVEHARGRTLSTSEYMAAEAHHGGRQHKAASTWSLSSPKSVVMATPPLERARRNRRTRTVASAAVRSSNTSAREHTKAAASGSSKRNHCDPLSPSAFVLSFSSEGSSHQRAHARKTISPKTQRPIELQRAAASLAAHAPLFNTSSHIGVIADGIHKAGIDPTRWTGRDIAQALSRHTAENGQIWPTASEIKSPAAFLRFKLSQLDWTGPSPSEKRAEADTTRRREIAERHAESARQEAMTASASSRAAARAAFAEHLAKARTGRSN
ncbi:Rep protein [Rhodococcus erythropolis]|uniref:Rep protein n=1 Tax=Rhodococcus erythropolis TaxID=1833 RepID=UPI001C9B9E0E|nr:Rep protein [Rhodococcus erythropolis]MBY6389544.1 Rep protein [Rhodococcus erythropolis]